MTVVEGLQQEGEIRRTRAPTHPGELLREDIIPALRISQRKLADVLKLTPQHLNRILRGEASIKPAIAIKLGTPFRNDPRFWLAMQDSYDLWVAQGQDRLAAEVEYINRVRNDFAGVLRLKV